MRRAHWQSRLEVTLSARKQESNCWSNLGAEENLIGPMRSKSIKFLLAHVLQSGFDLPVGLCERPLRVRSGCSGTLVQQSATDLRCELREMPWCHGTEERIGARLTGNGDEGRG